MRTKKKKQNQKRNEIDLHGVRHGDVQRILDQFLHEEIKRGTREVHIITGHSEKMKDIVEDVLADYELHGEEDFLNKGQLNVKIHGI